MAATLETLTLAVLVAVYFLLTAAELFLRVRRARRSRQRRRQQQQEQEEQVIPPAPPRETPAGPEPVGEEEEPAGDGGREKQKQRRRRRARRKRQQEGEGGCSGAGDAAAAPPANEKAAGKGEPQPLLPRRPQFPLASVAGALQRRINERYDDLARASQAQCLTIEQVNEFINCLKDARNELLQRYENVQRSFKIKKAMLSNHQNYRSSHGRLFEQLCRLEIERDNLKKDAAIYNSLQERLQASAPYKLIMELSAMEVEVPEISFEELLAQEKEDTAFWQKMRSVSSKQENDDRWQHR